MTIKIKNLERRIADQGIRTATLAAGTVVDHAINATGDAQELPMLHGGDHAAEIAIETAPANTDVTDHERTETRDAAAATTTTETTSRLQSAAP